MFNLLILLYTEVQSYSYYSDVTRAATIVTQSITILQTRQLKPAEIITVHAEPLKNAEKGS